MPTLSVNSELVLPVFRKAITTLKAAIVVSAAAILSQGQGDLEANASAALGHYDDFAAQLRAISDSALRRDAAPPPESDASTIQLDGNLLDLMVGIVDDRTARLKQTLLAVVGSPERDGLDAFVASIGEVGTALHDVTALLTTQAAKDDAPAFRYDQFFLESMQDLSQRDWSAT
jgi:hypothetical protein